MMRFNDESMINIKLLLILLAITIIGHVGIIANPGFFSHDEWDRFDFVEAFGLTNFISAFGRVIPGPGFGHPVRPLGFIQQGVSAQWMQSAPIIPHLIDVAIKFSIAAIILLTLLNIDAK